MISGNADMTMNGGWTLIAKMNGDTSGTHGLASTAVFNYSDPLWTNALLLADTNEAVPGPTPTQGNAKYTGWTTIPVTQLRGDLDGRLPFNFAVAGTSAMNVFNTATLAAPTDPTMTSFPVFDIENDPNFRMQPNCRVFGVNANFDYAHARFGFGANGEADCTSNDSSIGFGIEYTAGTDGSLGSGFLCQAAGCEQGNTTVAADNNRVGAPGYLYVK